MTRIDLHPDFVAMIEAARAALQTIRSENKADQ